MAPHPDFHKQSGYRNRKHPQIDDDYYAGNPLRANTYYGKDLARILWQQYQSPISERVSTAQKALLRGPVPECRDEDALQELLNQWMGLFDQAFFFNAIGKRWRTVTLVHLHDGSGKGASAYGWYDHEGRGVCINVDLPPERGYRGSVESWHICTLLHEMVHAFLRCYTCMRAEDGCLRKWEPRMGGEGRNGHGPAWANGMIVVQESLRREVGWHVECGVSSGVRHAMRKTGWRARPDQLERWGMSG